MVYLILRIKVLPVDVKQFPDTAAYIQVASQTLWSPVFWGSTRPFTVPLFYKLVGSEPLLVATFQWTLSTVSWGVLATLVARRVRSYRLKPGAFAIILLFSLSWEIIQWDHVMLSESLSFSGMALFIACWLWLQEGWSWSKAFIWGLCALLWGFTRDTNAYFCLMIAGALVIFIALKLLPRQYMVIAIVFVGIFVTNNISSNAGQRWVFPFLNVLGQRILTNPERTTYFTQLGMPMTPALMQRADKWASSDDYAFYKDSDLAGFLDWVYASGKLSYGRFLIEHHSTALTEPVKQLKSLVLMSPAITRYRHESFIPPLQGGLAEIIYPRSWFLLTIEIVGIIGLFFLATIWKPVHPASFVAVVLILLTYPLAFLIWHADAMEVDRHALPVAIQLRLGLWLMLLFAVDSIITKPVQPAHKIPRWAYITYGFILAMGLWGIFDWVVSNPTQNRNTLSAWMSHYLLHSEERLPHINLIEEKFFTFSGRSKEHIVNSSFDTLTPLKGDLVFSSWEVADFWNNFQAEGWRKRAEGVGSTALELGLTQAIDYPYHLGVQQDCGKFKAGALVGLAADVFIPHDLSRAYAAIDAVIYHSDNPQKYVTLTLRPKNATSGWVKLATANWVPTTPPGDYSCMLIVHLVAEQPLANVNNVARFDNIELYEADKMRGK